MNRFSTCRCWLYRTERKEFFWRSVLRCMYVCTLPPATQEGPSRTARCCFLPTNQGNGFCGVQLVVQLGTRTNAPWRTCSESVRESIYHFRFDGLEDFFVVFDKKIFFYHHCSIFAMQERPLLNYVPVHLLNAKQSL